MKLILATTNQDKIKEIKEIIKGNIEILTLDDLNIENFEVIEDGKTLKENAFKKAITLYKMTHIPTISDDTGLFVNALGNKPGVYSHRYANSNPTYKQNRDKLLDELKNVENRKAYFMTVICFIDNNGKDHYFSGKINGEISHKEHGNKEFGYDQIFKVNGKTFGQMKDEEKNSYSHRALALNEFKKFLEENYDSISS